MHYNRLCIQRDNLHLESKSILQKSPNPRISRKMEKKIICATGFLEPVSKINTKECTKINYLKNLLHNCQHNNEKMSSMMMKWKCDSSFTKYTGHSCVTC